MAPGGRASEASFTTEAGIYTPIIDAGKPANQCVQSAQTSVEAK